MKITDLRNKKKKKEISNINIHLARDILKKEVTQALEKFEDETALTVRDIKVYHGGSKRETKTTKLVYSLKGIDIRIELKEHLLDMNAERWL